MLSKARADGVTHCPGYENHPCGRELDYDTPLLPESAETDHIIPVRFGGTDEVDNLAPLCRACNRAKGDGTRAPADFSPVDDFPLSRSW